MNACLSDVEEGVFLLANEFFKLSELYCKWLFVLSETTARISEMLASLQYSAGRLSVSSSVARWERTHCCEYRQVC